MDPDVRRERHWDVALSFAAAQRSYVEQVARDLKTLGVRCFYDADEQIELWGKYLAEELPAVYGEQSAAVVVFVSAEYAQRDWTRLERQAALGRAARERREYVLPARFDDTVLPGLLPNMGTIDLRRLTPQQFAAVIAKKLAALGITGSAPPADPAGPANGALHEPSRAAKAAGWPLDEINDPFTVEVHRPVRLEDQRSGLPALPMYVPREHDTELGTVVRAAADGHSGMAVLVGGSSTGKTRACWEALTLLRGHVPPWRLWHPISPSRPEAVLRDLPAVRPRTVVWLNEAQFYLDAAQAGLGERVAAGLREVLRDPARAPLLVVATLWPEFWDRLTAAPDSGADPHTQARELLNDHDIAVPPAFTRAQLRRLGEMGDPRLAAAAVAPDGEVTQFLAAAPELLSRYRTAPPAARGVIEAAMDARRLGMQQALPRAFLKAAAPGYLTDSEWDFLSEDWMEHALEYACKARRGIHGPLTRIRPRPGRGWHGSGESARAPKEDPVYRLADFLDQEGRRRRHGQIPPASFWAAAAAYAYPDDLAWLGLAARDRGLYRDAAQLWRNATIHGDATPACDLIYLLEDLNPADRRPADWVAASIALHDLAPVTWLYPPLRRLEAEHALQTVTARLVACGPLSDPGAVAELLEELREMGAAEQIATLLERDPARHASLADQDAAIRLLDELAKAGAQRDANHLAQRAAAHAPLDDPAAVATLLNSLRQRHALGHVAALIGRDPAGHASLDNAGAVAGLLTALQHAGAKNQVTRLADRAVRAVPLQDVRDIAALVRALELAEAAEQVTVLLDREPARQVSLDDAGSLAAILRCLQTAGASDQVDVLLGRDPAAHVSFFHPEAAAALLSQLREIGAEEQYTSLADRMTTAPFHPTANLPVLLDELRKTGRYARLLNQDPVTVNDPRAIAMLLHLLLKEEGMQKQITALAEHAATAPVEHPADVARLLRALHRANAKTQAAALASRAAATTPLRDPVAVAVLLKTMRETGAGNEVGALLDRSPAAHASFGRSYDAERLLKALQQTNAHEQVSMLTDRLPGEGLFDVWIQEGSREFRFGREADGSPAQPWDWDDLD